MRARAPRQAGFTLVEVLLAVGIVVTITTLLWAAFSSTLRIKRNTEEMQDRYHTIHLALDRMARDLNLAYLSQNELPSVIDRRTYFVYQPGMQTRLDFSYLGHQHLYRDAREGDSAIVSYYVGPDPDDRRRTHLWRRESRRLVTQPELQKTAGEAFVICPDVVSLSARFFDARQNDWRDEWNTTTADGQPNRLPTRVHLEVLLKDDRGVNATFTTDARIHLDEPFDGRFDQVR
jgi:general secretion pathway protein J